MPVCEYCCETCKREVTLRVSIREHEKRHVACPKGGGSKLRPLVSSFVSQTSRKS